MAVSYLSAEGAPRLVPVLRTSGLSEDGFPALTDGIDMGDPTGACKRAAEVLAPEGSALIVEPMAGNTVEENFNIIGRTFAGASTLCCTSNSLALNGPALGAVAPESAIREVVLAGGFTQFRRATETPFNRIFEARK